MQLTSPQFDHFGPIPSRFTCDGENVNPSLRIENVPEETEALVLIVEDPDASGTTPFVHWIIWNINPQRKEILAGEVPEEATEGINSANELGYTGPCPPSGTHRYYFRLFATRSLAELRPDSHKEDVVNWMSDHVIDSVELVGLYQRQA